MDERKIMDEFYGCRRRQYSSCVSSYRLTTEKMEDGTDELAHLTLASRILAVLPSDMISQDIAKRWRGSVNDFL
jgi:hypothetical protein